MPILPRRLRLGDTLGLIAPSSPPQDPKAVDQAITALEKMGFKVQAGRNLRKRLGFLAGKDAERAADIMRMFANPKIDGIVCLRGGYGAGRLLPFLDYDAIRQNAKVFVGFSDVTALHCALLRKSNLVSFHGPTAQSFSHDDCPEFTRLSWLKILMQATAVGNICEGYNEATVSILRRGKVSGELIGGNLSVLATIVGTDFQPSFRGKILFLEDVAEKPYRMDRLLTHLLNAGLLQKLAGIAIGQCSRCLDPKVEAAGEYRQTLEDVFKERLIPLNIPILMGLPFGHVLHNATLPVGGRALLDATKGELVITHAAVK